MQDFILNQRQIFGNKLQILFFLIFCKSLIIFEMMRKKTESLYNDDIKINNGEKIETFWLLTVRKLCLCKND